MNALTVALWVRRHWITPRTTDTEFSWAAPGGCVEAAFTLLDPLPRDSLNVDTLVRISSAATGEILWSGQILFPDAAFSHAGAMRVTCEGSSALLADRRFTFPYIVTRLDAWRRTWYDNALRGGGLTAPTSIPELDGGAQAVVATQNSDVVSYDDEHIQARFVGFDGPPSGEAFRVGGITGLVRSSHSGVVGGGVGTYRTAVFIGTPDSGGLSWQQDNTTRSDVRFTLEENPGAVGQHSATLDLQFVTTSEWKVPDERWTAWHGLVVAARRYDRMGNADFSQVRQGLDPLDIVEDLIGRGFLSDVVTPDLGRSPRYRDHGSTPRDLLYTFDSPEPVTPAAVLDELVQLNPDFHWMLGPMDLTDGLHGLTFTDWGKPRFVLDSDAVAWSSQGDDALYSRVSVHYRDAAGERQTVTVAGDYAKYPELESLDIRLSDTVSRTRVRQAPDVDISDNGASSRAAAERIANLVLDSLARRPRGGTATVVEPLVDMETGRVTPPEVLRPGVLVKVEGEPEPLRLTEVTVRDDGTAQLSIGNPRLTIQSLLAQAKKKGKS